MVGGSKSASDMVLNFERAGYKNYTWLYRKPYIFMKFERAFNGRGILDFLSGLLALVGCVLMLVSKQFGGLVLWSTGYITTFGAWHNDWSKFRWGILCPTQRRILEESRPHQKVGNPIRLTQDGFVLADGSIVPGDVVIYGTGYKTGVSDLKFEKDGAPFRVDPNMKLLNHFIFPTIPVFANATSLWTTFGPVRGTNAADMVVYHLCVRRAMTEQQMQTDANWNLGKSSASCALLFDSRFTLLREWMYMYVDLMLRGILALEDFLYHGLSLFCFKYQPPLRFNVFPSGAEGSLRFFVEATDGGTDDWLAGADVARLKDPVSDGSSTSHGTSRHHSRSGSSRGGSSPTSETSQGVVDW